MAEVKTWRPTVPARLDRSRLGAIPASMIPVLTSLVVFWPRITDGGFTIDDWSNRATLLHSTWHDQLSVFLHDPIGHRTLAWPYASVYNIVLGDHPRLSILWAVVSAGVLGTLIAQLLFRCGAPRWAATAVGTLGAIFPYATVTKIWFTAHFGHISGALAVVGVLLALRGLRSTAPAARVAWHVSALVLYLASLLLYEIALPIVVGSLAFYLAAIRFNRHRSQSHQDSTSGEPPYRRAVIRWIVDLAVVGLWYSQLGKTRFANPDFSLVDRVATIGSDGLRNIAGSFAPFLAVESRPGQPIAYSGAWLSNSLTAVIVGAVITLAVLCIIAPAMAKRNGPTRLGEQARRALPWGVAILVAIVAAYLAWIPILKATDYYRPLPQNSAALRVNVIAAFALAAVVVSTIGALVEVLTVLSRSEKQARSMQAAAISLALVAVAVPYCTHARSEIRLWNSASAMQRKILDSIRLMFDGKPPSGTTVMLTDTPAHLADDAEVFGASWTLRGALQSEFNDPTLDGVAHHPAETVFCARGHVLPFNVQYWNDREPTARPKYDKTYFVSISDLKSRRITDVRSCEEAAEEFSIRRYRRLTEAPPIGEPNS